LAGEAPDLFAMGIGDGTNPMQWTFCAEPRDRDQQYKFLMRCAERMRPFVEAWDLDENALPQVITTSKGATRLFLAVADRMYSAPDTPDELRKFGRRLHFFYDSFERPDSAALLDMPSALCKLHATGQDEQADQHLGALLEWLKPADGSIHARVREAEGCTVSTSTHPDLDNDYLVPYSEELAAAKDAGDDATVESVKAKMGALLRWELKHRYGLVRDALRIVSGFPDSELSVFVDDCDRDRFKRHRVRALNPKKKLARRLKAVFGQVEFLERELAHEHVEALMARSVSGARAAARLAGEFVVGEVVDRFEEDDEDGLRVEYLILSRQPVLSIRSGDELELLDGAEPFEFVIDDIDLVNGGYLISAHLGALKTLGGQPQKGDAVELGKPVPSKGRNGKSMKLAKDRLWNVQRPSQVHGPVPVTHDLLAAVRTLRSN